MREQSLEILLRARIHRAEFEHLKEPSVETYAPLREEDVTLGGFDTEREERKHWRERDESDR